MYLLDICNNSDVLKVLVIIKLALRIVTIILPIIMMVNLCITVFKSVVNSQELTKNLMQNFKQLIAALLVFFIPTIIEFTASLVSPADSELMQCIENASIEKIEKSAEENARELITKTYENFNSSTYQDAKSAISKIKDKSIREKYTKQLEEAKKVNNLKVALNSIKEGTTEENKLAIQTEIDKLKDEKIKSLLTEQLSKVPILEGFGPSLNIDSSFKKYTTGNENLPHYSLYIPEKAREKMPLIVVVPSSSGNYGPTSKVFEDLDLTKLKAFILVVEAGAEHSTSRKAILNQIDQLVEEYKLNDNAISLTGFSSSGTYVYKLVLENKGKFAALVPVSSGYNFDKLSQTEKDYLKKLPMKGYGETGGRYGADGSACPGWTDWYPATAMTKMFTGLDKAEDFTHLGKICHNTVMKTTFTIDKNNDGLSDVLEWMSEQNK